jgi:hypothetical protein
VSDGVVLAPLEPLTVLPVLTVLEPLALEALAVELAPEAAIVLL